MTKENPNGLRPGARILLVSDAPSPDATGQLSKVTTGVRTTLENVRRELGDQGYQTHIISPDKFPTWTHPRFPEVPFPRILPGELRRDIREYQPDAMVVMSPELVVGRAAKYSAALYPQDELEGGVGVPYAASYTTNFGDYAGDELGKMITKFEDKYGKIPDWVTSELRRGIENTSNKILKAIYQKAKTVFVPTERMKNRLADADVTNTVIWERGVDSKRFRPLGELETNVYENYDWYDELPVLLSYGRIAPEKKVRDFLDLDINPKEYHRVVIGDGPSREELEAEYGKNVHFLGKRHGDDLARHVRSSRLMFFPSDSETWGQAATEAAASGTPVVAYDVQGPGDILTPGVNGILIPMGRQLTDGIEDALAIDPIECAVYTADRFRWDRAAKVLVENVPRIHWRADTAKVA